MATTVIDETKVRQMLEAVSQNNLVVVDQLLTENPMYARQQLDETGQSPLMVASSAGNLVLVQKLLDEYGAPWNALDRQGLCAGDYATQHQHWDVVNYIVEFATRAELILGEIQRSNRNNSIQQQQDTSTKTDYLTNHRLKYNEDGTALLDNDNDAVMMAWETPIMKVHASVMLRKDEETDNGTKNGNVGVGGGHGGASSRSPYTVLNVGFGMGIIDTALQDQGPPFEHHIIEAHPDVYHQKIVKDGWLSRKGVHVHFGKWQDVIPKLVENGIQMDAIFFDTYAEHAHDMEDFHRMCFSVPQQEEDEEDGDDYNNGNNGSSIHDGAAAATATAIATATAAARPRRKRLQPLLKQPHGIYTFFNGLAPDNLFFHGVACNVIKLQLSRQGLDSEFLQCQMEAPNSSKIWQDVRRRYWHGRDTYYLPKVTWNKEFLGLKNKERRNNDDGGVHDDNGNVNGVDGDDMMVDDDGQDTKRRRM
eukprot:CAMPEP_0113444748 /NCGR_PEP_ID=MMETSP0014_2-20120614/2828_1 /TAXON_ID=2857 /ORGANISM="Nitzschia sp." /LENGTH=476 /DNA_ID=CAMNT_0000335773 /DNA_START=192 /DNA_END=1622 /DNA_ORIENTATION=- /assembly_acc=CAM_ASM_000159